MNQTLTFNKLLPDGYYFGAAANYDGYGGFNFDSLMLISKAAIEHYHVEDSGYGNALHGNGEAIVAGRLATSFYYGSFYAPNPTASRQATFDLRSAVFAAAKPDGSGWYDVAITSFSERGSVKDNIQFKLSSTAETIHFDKYGAGFDDIAYVGIESNRAMVVMDNLKVQWTSAALAHGSSGLPSGLREHVAQHRQHIAHVFLADHPNQFLDNTGRSNPSYVQHGELTSLAAALGHADPGSGLTALFLLPHCEHFGT